MDENEINMDNRMMDGEKYIRYSQQSQTYTVIKCKVECITIMQSVIIIVYVKRLKLMIDRVLNTCMSMNVI